MVRKDLGESKQPKVILEFTLPENKDELTLALKGPDYYFSLWDLFHWVRGEVKYNDNYSEKEIALLDTFREKIYQVMDKYGCSLEDAE